MQYIYLYKYKCVWIYGLYNMNMDIFNEYVYIYTWTVLETHNFRFSCAGLKITFGLKVMDAMTQFWCRKVGLSRLFYVILRYMFGHSKCD